MLYLIRNASEKEQGAPHGAPCLRLQSLIYIVNAVRDINDTGRVLG